MTSPSYISLWFFIVIIYAVIFSKPASSQTPLINNICHRTTFLDFCRHILMSNPISASPNANLYTLGQVTCTCIRNNVTDATDQIAIMMAYERNEDRFQRLHICLDVYKTLVKCMSRLSSYWGKKKFRKAEAEARMGINKVAECEAAFTDVESPLGGDNLTLRRLFTMAAMMSDIATL